MPTGVYIRNPEYEKRRIGAAVKANKERIHSKEWLDKFLKYGKNTRFKKGNPSNRKGTQHTEETRKKMSESRKGIRLSKEHIEKLKLAWKGKHAWNWIKDRTKLKKQNRRNDSLYKEWRIQVYRRDGFRCIIGDKCKGRIEAHHILGWTEYPELRYKINNGITLCHAHHPKKRSEEKRLSPYFQSLVSVSKD